MPALSVMGTNHFSEVTENNHAGIIWIISLLGMVYTALAFFARFFIKWHMLGPDDFVLVAAQVFAFGQYGALFSSLHHGLGRASEMLTVQSRETVSRTAFISQLLLIFSLGLSKCSVILLIRRVFTRDLEQFWLTCNILASVVCVWVVGSVIAISAGCSATNYVPPQGNETCSGFATRWQVVVALDVVTEVIMFLLPIAFLRHLQMTVSMKGRVVLAFAFRLPVIALVLVFLTLFTKVAPSGTPGVSVSTPIVWQQLALSYSLISASIPCLKSFIRSFDTNFGMGDGSSEGQYNYSSGHSQSRSHNSSHTTSATYHPAVSSSKQANEPESFKMHALRPRQSANFWRSHQNTDKEQLHQLQPQQRRRGGGVKDAVGRLRPDRVKNSTTVVAGGKSAEVEHSRSGSRDSCGSVAGSQELIIRRDVQIDVVSDYSPARGSLGG